MSSGPFSHDAAQVIKVNFREPVRRRRRGPVVRALGLHAVAPGSNPVLTLSQIQLYQAL